jgi:aspartyl-tRNA(Asn)/glutamyl-tRNA(Gln) amidotransferase subunit B
MAAVGGLVRGRSGALWQVCVGLEVHALVAARHKLFSPAPAGTGLATPPNSAVALFDAAHPGALPSLSDACLSQALRAGITLRGSIPPVTAWERKHYAYPDLPHGYQITQLERPVVSGGFLLFDVRSEGGAPPRPSIARISRLQLEQDSGKTVHTLARGASVVDLNRAGCALLEVVGAPDLRGPAEAGGFVRELTACLRHGRVAAGRVEEGGLRVDVNVSLRPVGEDEAGRAATPSLHTRASLWADLQGAYGRDGSGGFVWVFRDEEAAARAFASFPALSQGRLPGDSLSPPTGAGPRVEVKNLAGPRAVEDAIAHEAARQVAIVEGGGEVEQETRTFDASSCTSARLRSKAEGRDYRFLPEPDVPPVVITAAYFAAAAASLPPSMDEERARLGAVYALGEAEATGLVAAHSVAAGERGEEGGGGLLAYFDAAVSAAGGGEEAARAVASWVLGELPGQLGPGHAITACAVGPGRLGSLIDLVARGSVSGKAAKRVLAAMLGGDGRPPADIVTSLGMGQINDRAAIAVLVATVLGDAASAPSIAKWRGGQERVLGSLVALVIEASGGRANPALVSDALRVGLGPLVARDGGAHVGRKAKAKAAAEAAAKGGAQ